MHSWQPLCAQLAVEEWGKLSVAEKKAYTEDFKATHLVLDEDEAAAIGLEHEDVDIEGDEPGAVPGMSSLAKLRCALVLAAVRLACVLQNSLNSESILAAPPSRPSTGTRSASSPL